MIKANLSDLSMCEFRTKLKRQIMTDINMPERAPNPLIPPVAAPITSSYEDVLKKCMKIIYFF